MADESWEDIIAEAGDSFDRPPEGEYDFIVHDAVAGTGKKAPHNPNIKVKLRITSGPHAGKSIKEYYIVRSIDRADKFMRNLQALGITPDVLREHKPTMAQIAKAIIGRQVRGEVVHKSDKRWGDSAELNWQMNAPEGGAIPLTSFPKITEAESLGYSAKTPAAPGAPAAPSSPPIPTVTDPGF